MSTPADTLPRAAPRLYAQKAQELVRDLERVIDGYQQLAVEIDDPRDDAVIRVADLLLDAKHHARRLVRLLGMS